jgi:L-threonylcarbamoyladenylate synthase
MITIVGTDINEAAKWLEQGELVAIPTETVYGLAANASNENAIVKVFETKQRPSFNPLILHVASIQLIEQYATLNQNSAKLAQAFMPGPFSLLLPKKQTISNLITAGSNLVAVRIPNHALLQSLLAKLPFALVAPSANMFGYVSPTNSAHVYNGLQGKIPYILNGGASQVGLESTIVEANDDEVIIHRNGAITEQDIKAVLPNVTVKKYTGNAINTPGQIKSHYATKTPLIVSQNIEATTQELKAKNIAYLLFSQELNFVPSKNQFVLSQSASLQQAAMHLFDTMQKIDAMGFDYIIAEVFPNQGIGIAINDRLHRAQHHFK